ncbi:MAG: prefoldin subunit alpha [Candidatus Pacearchaeota archaeon]|nr:prefoldin subunit alpha [Candidatus Pacearchaeota archaeon]
MSTDLDKKTREDEKKNIEKKIVEFNLLDSRIKEVEQSLAILEKQIAELQACQLSFDELKDVKKNVRMLAPMGPGIFVEAKIEDSSNVLIDLGSRILCKKSLDDAKRIIQSKLDQALDVHAKLVEEIDALLQRISKLEKNIKESA